MNTLTLNTTSTAYKNTSILFWAFLIFFFTNSPLHAATMKVDNGFESGNLSGFACSGNCPSVVTSPVATPKYSGNFDLTRNMTTNYRTEVEGVQNFVFGQEYWFGFSYRYEDWAKDSDAEIAPFQIHTRPSSWNGCNLGNAVGTAPFLMMSQNDEVQFRTYGSKIMWRGAVQKKQWLGITVHFKISAGSDGFVEAWKDGVKLGRVDGPNSPKLDKCGEPMRDPYFKMGVYKWNWQRTATDSSRRQLFIDNLKIAQGTDAYSMVSSTPTTTPPTTAPIDQDTTPPVISNVQAAVTETTATITWETNEASDSAVQYGATTGYGLNAGNSLAVTSHSVILKDLTAGSLYHYQVNSKDSSGNTGKSADLTFATSKAPDPGLIDDGIVAYWPMDPGTGSTLPDLSANGYTGTLVNGAVLTTSGGVKFDGVNDYVNVGKFDVAGKAMTISAWFFADDLANCSYRDCRIISKATGPEEQDHYFMVSPVKVNATDTRLRFRIKTNGVTSTLIAASGNLSNKTWFHVAAVYDGQTMRLYKDGVEVGSKAASGNITANSNVPVWIGGNPPDATSRPWKGQIDDVSIYSYALTKEEIATLDPTPPAPKDTTPPAISNVQAAVTETTATITWETNEASDSAVQYGATTSYGLNTGSSVLATTHSVTLNNLTAGTLYHYRLSSKDSSGNTGSSADLTFATNKAIDPGLVAYWPMDPGTGSILPDLSANGYTGTLVNGAVLTTSGGV
ncbi:MAG: LamG-like jellyroll fold domain-containing protein, partial [Gammaproteobacteria bacterium]